MKNKKNIVISLIFVIIIVIVILFLIIYRKNFNNEKPNPTPDISVERPKEQIIYEIAIDLYKSGKYLSFPRIDKEIYFATKNILKNLGYDETLIVSSCDYDEPIIYFDVNYKLNDSYEFEPIVFKTSCDTN